MSKNEYEERILEYLKEKREATTKKIAKDLRIGRNTAGAKLRVLQAKGQVEVFEKGRARLYRVKGGEAAQ